MESDPLVDMDVEFLPSMWPKDVGNEPGKKFNVDNPGANDDMLEEVTIMEDLSIVDFKRLLELTDYSEKGSSQLAYLVKQWEHRQENVTRLLSEELDILSRQRREVELKKLEILEEHQFEEMWKDNKHPVSVLDDIYDTWKHVPQRKNDAGVQNRWIETCGEVDSIIYWKQRAVLLENLLDVSIQREQVMVDKLQESIKHLERQCSPVDELSQILKRADNFLHFILQNAPIVIGHQDKELRYRFIYNHFPSLHEKDIIGRTDLEIFSGAGVKESHDFKKEVLERGKAAKREITFTTELFGSKTFLIYVEPVFSKEGETIGVNYTGMEITDQVKKREKMAKLREEIAVQNAKETEMNKTIHMTEETMRAKQLLATMSHEIRSPLSGVVSMAEILATTKLDREQQQLLDVMLSSGDLVLQLINDILDLSKVESGVMKLEATKFRPREVIKHVLQTAAASLQKRLTLEGHVAEDVPLEVIGDVLRIRQIFTNLVSNAIKFTHEGKVGIRLYVVADPRSRNIGHQNITPDWLMVSSDKLEQGKCAPRTGDMVETVVWLGCDVYDTGIGIPENALPTLFKKYMQVSADHTRKYGGTGLGLAICKQLVELIGGHLTVSSREHHGSTFTFVLPYIVSPTVHPSDDPDELSYMGDQDMPIDANSDESNISYFQFHPGALGSLPFPGGSGWVAHDLPANNIKQRFHKPNGLYKNLYEPPSNNGSHVHSSSINGIAAALHPKLDNTNLVGRGKDHFKDESNDKYQNPRITAHCLDASIEMGEATKSNRSEEMPNCKHKILLVEDNKINVIVTESMMRHLGHSIDVVNNGIEAVHAVQQNTYDLILMDVYMPVMDGLQATRLIRSFEETGSWDSMVQAGLDIASPDLLVDRRDTVPYMKPVPIIAMTANALSESASECLENGMDSFLPKPVTFQKLKECLRRYLPR